jgi:hypothetical protein
MTEIVERLRAGYAGDAPFPFDRAPMALTVEPVYLVRDHDMREIAASLAAKDKEIERLANRLSFEQRAARVSQARAEQAESALAEAVEERDRLRDDIRQLWGFGTDELRICEHCDAWMTIEEAARVEDVSLCPREAFGSIKFPDEKCFKHRAWIVKEERESARAFVAQHGSDSREGK